MHSSASEQLPYWELRFRTLPSLQKVLASMASLEFYHDPKHYHEEGAVSLQT